MHFKYNALALLALYATIPKRQLEVLTQQTAENNMIAQQTPDFPSQGCLIIKALSHSVCIT